MKRVLAAIFALLFAATATRAAEPFFKPGDVIALVGGEDMVVAAELGYLETLIQLALPDHKLKFRSLAREGDTVFEQRRDLNYPSLETQLDKMGATVVICQFGQMESIAAMDRVDPVDPTDATHKAPTPSPKPTVNEVNKFNPVPEPPPAPPKAKVEEFIVAYEKMIGRLKGNGRRIIIAEPHYPISHEQIQAAEEATVEAVRVRVDGARAQHPALVALAKKLKLPYIESAVNHHNMNHQVTHPKGVRIDDNAQSFWAYTSWDAFVSGRYNAKRPNYYEQGDLLRPLITAKNRLWFHYYRPQNWAFLAGDRTNQPSSRDHLDRNKRWFPEELEKFVPLIEAKDAEIWALAKKLQ